jgi:hypothetical protein
MFRQLLVAVYWYGLVGALSSTSAPTTVTGTYFEWVQLCNDCYYSGSTSFTQVYPDPATLPNCRSLCEETPSCVAVNWCDNCATFGSNTCYAQFGGDLEETNPTTGSQAWVRLEQTFAPTPASPACSDDFIDLDGESSLVNECPLGWTCSGACTTRLGNSNLEQQGANYFFCGYNAETGTMVSDAFNLPEAVSDVRILRCGGANSPSGFRVRRVSDDEVLCAAQTGTNTDIMFEDTCALDLDQSGERVYLEITDQSTGGWGKTWVDNIRVGSTTAGQSLEGRICTASIAPTTAAPTTAPSGAPTSAPSVAPTTKTPTTKVPTTKVPTSKAPTAIGATYAPTKAPTAPTSTPSRAPTLSPVNATDLKQTDTKDGDDVIDSIGACSDEGCGVSMIGVIVGVLFLTIGALGLWFGLKKSRNSKWADKRRTMQSTDRTLSVGIFPKEVHEMEVVELDAEDAGERVDMTAASESD